MDQWSILQSLWWFILETYMHCKIGGRYIKLDMHPLAAASRSRLLETEPKLFLCSKFRTMRSVDDIALNMSL